MTVQTRLKPPFRAEHVGSFLRPQRLIEAARAHKAGTLDAAGFAKVQDDCVRQVVAFQENIGLRSITDGEFRRESWRLGFVSKVAGFARADAFGNVDLQRDEAGGVMRVGSAPVAVTSVRSTPRSRASLRIGGLAITPTEERTGRSAGRLRREVAPPPEP